MEDMYHPERMEKWSHLPHIKKGNRNDCQNYRDITLLNTDYGVYAKIITQ